MAAQHAAAPDGRQCERKRPRVSRNVGRTDKNQEHGSIRRKNKSHRAAASIGVVGITSASKSREWALSGGGTLSGFPSVGGVNSGHEPSVRPGVAVGPWGCSIMSASGSHVLALPHGGASAAGAVSVGHGRHRRVVQRMSPHSFERVGASGRWAGLERRAEVTGIDRGSRCRRHRAAWRLTRNVVASSPQSCWPGLIRTFGSPGRCAENGRGLSRVTVRVSPPLA